MRLILRGETHLARQWVAEAHAIAREHAMSFMAEVMVPLLDGFALIEQGDYAEGYAKLTAAHQSLAGRRRTASLSLRQHGRAKALIGLQALR